MAVRKTYEDIIDHKFGKLTVIGLVDKEVTGNVQRFYCTCDCGTKNYISTKFDLLNGRTKSCKCLHKDQENLIGQVFSRLTVIKKLNERDSSGTQIFLCKCFCGNETKAVKRQLKKGEKKSCGCLSNEIRNQNILGKKFGKLLVINKLGHLENRDGTFWECLCDCGNKTNVITGNLTHSNVKSCGCLSKEKIRAYRISKGKDPDISTKSEKVKLRDEIKKLNLHKLVFIRDNYTCNLCNQVGKKLNIHHIIPLYVDESKALDMNNLITLCKKCHFEKAHNKDYHKVNKELQEQFIKQNSLSGEAI